MNEVVSVTFDTTPITISAKLNGSVLAKIIPASRRSLVHFQVVAHHLPEADMHDVAVRQLSLWVSRIFSFSLLFNV